MFSATLHVGSANIFVNMGWLSDGIQTDEDFSVIIDVAGTSVFHRIITSSVAVP